MKLPMSSAAKSLMGCAFYIIPTGLGLLVCPNLLLKMFGVPETQEVFLRIVGMLLVFLGLYYIDAAHAENKIFMKRTIQLRVVAFFIFCGFAISGMGPTVLYLFAAADLAGAVWTWKTSRV